MDREWVRHVGKEVEACLGLPLPLVPFSHKPPSLLMLLAACAQLFSHRLPGLVSALGIMFAIC